MRHYDIYSKAFGLGGTLNPKPYASPPQVPVPTAQSTAHDPERRTTVGVWGLLVYRFRVVRVLGLGL